MHAQQVMFAEIAGTRNQRPLEEYAMVDKSKKTKRNDDKVHK